MYFVDEEFMVCNNLFTGKTLTLIFSFAGTKRIVFV